MLCYIKSLFTFRLLSNNFFMYFFLDKKVPKNKERKDIQHFSFIRRDVDVVLL